MARRIGRHVFRGTDDHHLAAGEERRRALRTVVMARYFEPLRIYVKGSSYRHLGESAELVSAFFRFASVSVVLGSSSSLMWNDGNVVSPVGRRSVCVLQTYFESL